MPLIAGFPITGGAELKGRPPRPIRIERSGSRDGMMHVEPEPTAALLRAESGDGDGSEMMILPGLDLPYPIPRSVLLLAARGELTLRAGINLLDPGSGDEREDREGKSK